MDWVAAIRTEPPLAVFAHCDYSAWGVFEACRELGLRIPEDVSIVCFDNSAITSAMTPPMTSVAQRTVEVGPKALELLEHRLQQSSTAEVEPEHVLVEVDLIRRQSVSALVEGRSIA